MASKRIAGITIEIDGNTSKLQKALQGVDKQLSTTKNNLKDVDKLLKMNPGNTELLTQKQKLLTEAIGSTKERLAQLKEAQKNALSPEEYDALQREIIETENNLKSLEKEYNSFGSVATQKLKTAGESMKQFGDKVTKAGSSITKSVTVPILGIGTAAVASAKDLDNGYDTIITKTGATGKELEGLKKQMNNVFTSIPTDAETAGKAIGEVNTRFGLLDDELGDVSKSFIEFAQINNTDVSNSIDTVDRIMTKYGLDTKDVNNVLGALTKASQETGVSVDTLGNALDTNGEYFKELDLSVGASIDLLAQFEKNGVDSSTALAGLKKAQQNATKEGKTLSQSLYTTSSRIKNAKTQTEALEIATELFGKKGALEMTNAIREGRFNLDQLSTSIDNYGDTVEKTYKETLDPWDDMKVALNNLKLAGSELAESLFSTLKPIIDKVVDSVKAFTDWFNSLNDKQKETIVKIGLVVAALGPFLIIGGKIISGLGSVVSGIGSVIGIGAKLISGIGTLLPAIGSLVSAAAPFLIGGAIIAGIVAAVVLIVKNWDKIKDAAKKLKEGILKAWDGIKTGVSNAGKAIGQAASKAWGSVKSGASTAWNNIKQTVQNAAQNVSQSVANGLSTAKQKATEAWNQVVLSTTNAWTNIKQTIATGATNAFTNLKSTISTAASTIVSGVKTAFSGVYEAIMAPFNKVKNAISNVVQGIKNAFKFKISLPKIKLPHISVKWTKIGDYFKIPHLSVQWYKKAYDNAMMFTKPTVLQTAAGAKGFGDGNGAEIVLGLNKLKQLVGSSGDMNTTINIYAQPGMDVNQLADAVQYRLAALQKQKEAVYA